MKNKSTNIKTILVLNAGSSSLKVSLYDLESLSLIKKDKIEIQSQDDYENSFLSIINTIEEHNVMAIGHRVVHGGTEFSAPVKIDKDILDTLYSFETLAPLHQPHNLKPITLISQKNPQLPQIACFDTAFHRTMPTVKQIYALPADITEQGYIKYGFHGTSYEYIASILEEKLEDSRNKSIIIAHLGNGASLCALKDLKSVSTTMGFTPLDGLMMGTRCGTIDPGLVLHFVEKLGLEATSTLLRKNSGLKGVSSHSSDMRNLLEKEGSDAHVDMAIELFCLNVAKHIALLTVDLGGLDALVFTAGIGENAPKIRKKICAHLTYLGLILDENKNSDNQENISAPNSAVTLLRLKTNEGKMIAQHAKVLL
jgi:acetate kinase